MRSRSSVGSPRYAAWLSEKRVSPPTGGFSISWAIDPSYGHSIQVTSVCQPFS